MYGVYRRIVLPLGIPALLPVGVLGSLLCWNDAWNDAGTMLERCAHRPDHDAVAPERRTLMIGVNALRGQYSGDIPVFASGVLIAAVPVLIINLVVQRQITGGVTAGSTKG
ncbi:hypothetical protein [Nonomuraea sp. NPDC048826]|uniref:hypothetical protein n=1 Tax=Nonomuraea sp. NPDC048826 TaxID=3364347 RepID=UPI00371CDB9B